MLCGRRVSYRAPLFGTIRLQLDDTEPTEIDRKLGEIPIMIRSCLCHLAGMSTKQLVQHGEEPFEFGGYFISVRARCRCQLLCNKQLLHRRKMALCVAVLLSVADAYNLKCLRCDGSDTLL